MRELAKLLLLSGLQNQTSPQRVLAFPLSNPVIIIPTAGAFPSPNLLTETAVVWDKGSGFNRTSSHLPTLPSVRAAFTFALIRLERDVPHPPLKGNSVQSLWWCPTLSNQTLSCRSAKNHFFLPDGLSLLVCPSHPLSSPFSTKEKLQL